VVLVYCTKKKSGNPGDDNIGPRSGDSDTRLDWIGRRWKELIDTEKWSLHPDPFWTYPHDYRSAFNQRTHSSSISLVSFKSKNIFFFEKNALAYHNASVVSIQKS
jgi:hypothetical protein